MEVRGEIAVAEDDFATLQPNASELERYGAIDDELDSPELSSCSTYSYDPADFPRAWEIEEFMSPSFRWADSRSASFASRPPGTDNIYRTTRLDHPLYMLGFMLGYMCGYITTVALKFTKGASPMVPRGSEKVRDAL